MAADQQQARVVSFLLTVLQAIWYAGTLDVFVLHGRQVLGLPL